MANQMTTPLPLKPLTWSGADEAQLKALQERRATFYATYRAGVIEALQNAVLLPKSLSDNDSASHDYIIDKLIAHAEPLRDALEPFDSGVRLPKPDATGGVL